jgi:NAD(P)-dependent dehydrogenase (short-subunit alcohol dehydrogenase family)
MSNPVVLITGALTRIGRATAVAFAKEGAKLVVTGRRRHNDEVRDLVDRTVARFGRLDIAVNNAGTEGESGPVTKSVALEVAKSGIRVNAVAPGPTDTGMLTRFTGTAENKAALPTQVPLGRLGLSEEVANGIVFIASDEAWFITGHVLNVDGGHSAN